MIPFKYAHEYEHLQARRQGVPSKKGECGTVCWVTVALRDGGRW